MSYISVKQSFVRFVYPFVFETELFERVIYQITEQAKFPNDEGKLLNYWDEAKFPKDDLLRYVADYLNPDSDESATAKMWRMSNHAFNSYNALGSRAEWALHTTQMGEDLQKNKLVIPFEFDSIELSLFRPGVGFLMFEVTPQSNQLDVWQNFIHFFRHSARESVKLTATRKVGREQAQIDFFPPFAEECRKDNCRRLEDISSGLLNQINLKMKDNQNWWRYVFVPSQMLPYAVLFVQSHPREEDDLLLFRLRKFLHTHQLRKPAHSDLVAPHPSRLDYAERQWQTFTLDGSAFLACDAPDTEFFRTSFPQNLRNEYFLLFLLVLQQRFALTNFNEKISKNWLEKNEDERAAAFERIREDFFIFTARGYFVQAMQREHHHRAYLRWQETFQIERFFREVRDSIREMHDYLQTRRTERLKQLTEKQTRQQETAAMQHDRKISLIGVLLAAVFGVPTLVIGFLNINLRNLTSKDDEGLFLEEAFWVVGAAVLIGIGLSLIAYLRYKREQQTAQTNEPNDLSLQPSSEIKNISEKE